MDIKDRVIRKNTITGPYSKAFNQVEKLISENIENCCFFKIGKTADPIDRISQQDYFFDFQILRVVFESDTKSHVENMEKEMVKRFKNNSKCLNVDDDSRGEMGDPNPNYSTYVVLAFNETNNLIIAGLKKLRSDNKQTMDGLNKLQEEFIEFQKTHKESLEILKELKKDLVS